MYHAIVRSRVKALWQVVGSGDFGPAVAIAAPGINFHFYGTTPISAELVGVSAFAKWFGDMFALFPTLTLKLTDVVVTGWPWRTTVVVQLDISAILADGSPYTNHAAQWAVLRWGRMVSDEVYEDTETLAAACRVQAAAR